MIKNIPEPDDFYISSMNYLNMAWGVAIEIQSAMTEISHSNLEREEVEAFKKSNKFYLNNCLMLVHQAVELYLKFRISEVNPLLLVDLKKSSLYKIDKSSKHPIGANFNWSPCGGYIAYSCSFNSRLYGIKIFDLKNKKNELLEEIEKNDMTQREVKDKIDVYNREPKSRYKQLNFWEDVG